jgi:hypothetical protein
MRVSIKPSSQVPVRAGGHAVLRVGADTKTLDAFKISLQVFYNSVQPLVSRVGGPVMEQAVDGPDGPFYGSQ